MGNLFTAVLGRFTHAASPAPAEKLNGHAPLNGHPATNGAANGHAALNPHAAKTKAPAKKRIRRNPDKPVRIRWADYPEADAILLEHYATKDPVTLTVMLAPVMKDCGAKITANRVIGRAHRLQLCDVRGPYKLKQDR